MAALFTILLGLGVTVLAYISRYFAFSSAADAPFMFHLSLLAILLMTLVILASYFISFFVVSRTNRIALTAENIIETGDLSQRLELDSGWDDLSRMSEMLNAFLERNEELVEGIKRVSDNIAHDLRTPLTRLRNNLEGLRKTSSDPATVDALIDEADKLLNTFSALLRIARIETAQQRTQFGEMRLDLVLRDVIDLYEPLAEQKKISLQLVAEESVYTGDKDLLFQAFANLLDNALKFTPTAGNIRLILRKEETSYICLVRDEGPGISDAEKDKVFSRFYRSEVSRHTSGNGLGLSLVAAVIKLHHGRIELQDATPGLLVKIRL
jgi:signal transduction histidine kinase